MVIRNPEKTSGTRFFLALATIFVDAQLSLSHDDANQLISQFRDVSASRVSFSTFITVFGMAGPVRPARMQVLHGSLGFPKILRVAACD